MTKTEARVFGAVVILGTDNKANMSTVMECNDIFDNYCTENPDEPLTDFINKFVLACYNNDFQTIGRCVDIAKYQLND